MFTKLYTGVQGTIFTNLIIGKNHIRALDGPWPILLSQVKKGVMM